jgi:hypothetical protein
MSKTKCQHKGYLMRGGELVCAECGEPSSSITWRQNVYGASSPEARTPAGSKTA